MWACGLNKGKCSKKQPEVFCKKWFEDLKASNFIKNRLKHRFFSVKFAKFLRRPVLKKYLRTTAPEF